MVKMSRTDIDRLFELLKIYFPRHQNVTKENLTLRSAWFLLLEPYDPTAVKQAVVEHLRHSTNFPDPQEIAILCETNRHQKERILQEEEQTREDMERMRRLLAQMQGEEGEMEMERRD
jgi:hypothetical protein